MADDNVRSMFGSPVVSANEPIPSIIELLEGMLDRAKSGEIRAIALVYVRGNGRPTTIKKTNDLDADYIWPLHSGLMCLIGDITDELNGNRREVGSSQGPTKG